MFNVQEESEVYEINSEIKAKLLEVARIANMERDLIAYKKQFLLFQSLLICKTKKVACS